MKKICLTAILLAFPAAQVWAGENIAVQARPLAESATEISGPVLLASNSREDVTTFRYSRPPGAAREDQAPAEAEPKKLHRSHSRPKVVVYGDQEAAASGPESPRTVEEQPRPIKKGLNDPEVTSFKYRRPAPVEVAEPVETQSPQRAPATRDVRHGRTAGNSAKAAESVETQSPQRAPETRDVRRGRTAKAAEKPGPARPEAPRTEEEARPRTPSKPEVKYTVLNERAEVLDMARPHTAVSRSRTARVRAGDAPEPPAPALESGGFDIAGVYVNCPKNKEENCGSASEEFRAFFPHDQTAPYLIIRKDGRGYVAPDNKRTVDFTWRFLGGDAVLIDLEGSQSRMVEYRATGRHLRNMVTGDLFYMSLTDDEWNVTPEESYSKLKARREKAGK